MCSRGPNGPLRPPSLGELALVGVSGPARAALPLFLALVHRTRQIHETRILLRSMHTTPTARVGVCQLRHGAVPNRLRKLRYASPNASRLVSVTGELGIPFGEQVEDKANVYAKGRYLNQELVRRRWRGWCEPNSTVPFSPASMAGDLAVHSIVGGFAVRAGA